MRVNGELGAVSIQPLEGSRWRLAAMAIQSLLPGRMRWESPPGALEQESGMALEMDERAWMASNAVSF
jgi:hypothetical protein